MKTSLKFGLKILRESEGGKANQDFVQGTREARTTTAYNQQIKIYSKRRSKNSFGGGHLLRDKIFESHFIFPLIFVFLSLFKITIFLFLAYTA